jgi:hypothetical protein
MRLFTLILALSAAGLTARAEDAPVRRAATAPVVAPSDYDKVHGREGFWRVAREAKGGGWWFVSPDGKREFLNSVTTVQPTSDGRDRNGASYVSVDYDPTADEAVRDRNWARATLRRVKAAGFKGIGAWSHPVFHELDVPITRDLNLWTWVPWESRRLFSAGWAEAVEIAATRQVDPLKNNRNLVGYYLDNELDWSDTGSGPGRYFDYLAANDPNKVEVVNVIKTIWPTVEAYNRGWNTNLKSWGDLLALDALPHTPQASYDRLYSAWLHRLASEYFRITTSIVRRHDPNHLLLGVRFRGVAPPEVIAASRDYTDAQSINYYPSDAKLDEAMFRAMHELSGQPVVVTEYSFHSLDNRSGARNTFGFGAQVPDQAARGEGYQLMTSRLARVPFVVGADWFQWADEPPSGRDRDGEDVAFGVVDIDDRAYEPLVEAVRATAPTLNDLHARADAAAEIWRERITRLPGARIPYLDKPPRINGELSDWPADAVLTSVRDSAAVGLKRTGVKTPVVRLGWRPDGLYVALEIFDKDVVALPAGGQWWTRDCVEFFVATQPVAATQDEFDANCHSFFFVPIAYPDSDGKTGTVGQWHRPGDTLKMSLIPHPQIRQTARVLKDRYVAEMFIPQAALHGYDPVKQPQLAYNVLVRDFQAAHESYWSAPKETLTHLRPNTWGLLDLDNPKPPVPTGLPVANTGLEGITQ